MLLAIVFGVQAVFSQHVLSGKVTAANGQSLAGAIINEYDGETSMAFGSSKQNGTYKLSIPKAYAKRPLTVCFRKLNYKQQSYNLPAGETSCSATLTPGGEVLREVIVKAPPVEQKGDTLRFNLGQFLSGTDVSLEDGLKRLPGINIGEGGTISYMGRDISQFYIEGLNLLGGRYNLATRNIPVDKVKGVEVLRHHQHNKVDKNELTNEVALNIRLSEKAKIKPFGTYEARAGLEEERHPLYGLSGTAMLFRKKFQLFTTLKLSNDGRLGTDEFMSHFGGISWSSGAEQILPLLSGSRPPFTEHRYKDIGKELFSANALQGLSEDNQLKVNANYAHEKTDYGYVVGSQYLMGELLYETQECLDFLQKKHKATIDIEFRSDKDRRLIENTFSLYGQFADAESDAVLDGNVYRQTQEQDAMGLRNAFSLVRKRNNWKWRLKSDVQYSEAPEGTLEIQLDDKRMALQGANSRMFKTRQWFYTGYEVLPGLTLALPVTFTLDANSLQTNLERKDAPAGNDLSGWNMLLNAAPSIDYQTPDRRFRIGADIPLKFLRNDYENRLADRRMRFNKYFADAALFFHFVLNANSNFEGRTDWWHSYGDYFSLLGNPIQTDYRTSQTRSGVFGSSRARRTRQAYAWPAPLTYWHFNTSVSYTRNSGNTIHGQEMDGNDLSLTERLQENTSDNVYVDAQLSKYLLGAKTNLSVGGHYAWSETEMLSAGKATTIHNNEYGGHIEVRTNPIMQLEATYRAEGTLTKQHTSGQKGHYTNYRQRFNLTYSPIETFNLRAGGEWHYTTLTDGNHKKALFLDARMEHKIPKKKIRLRLEMNNLLNKRNYSYTIYSGLNAFSYDYRLRGREILLSFVWM